MNMRKYFLIVMLLLTGAGAMAQTFVEVNNAKDFKTAAENNQNIRLTADIDIRNMGMINVTYKGIIDGLGTNASGDAVLYSLTGGTGDGRVKKPIFKALNGATLRNLVIRNFRIEWDDDDIGAVACTAKNSNFNQIVISEVSIFNDDDEAGAIVGKAEGCDFRNVRGMGNDVTVDGNYAGGFVGLSYNSVYCDCSNSAMSTVYADGSWGNAYAGGFVGESNNDQFVFCVNFASVGALDDRIGGIVGYSSKSVFSNCSNSGYVMHCKEDDFLNCTRKIKKNITDSFNDIIADLNKMYDKQDFSLKAGFASFLGTIGLSTVSFGVELALLSFVTCGAAFTVTMIIVATGIVVTLINLIDAEIGAHDEMGGICGTCEGTVFDCCTNYGTLMCRDSYVGGIVGLMRDISKNRITNCLNAGEIQGFEYAGGICGEGNPADRITNCLNVGKITVPSDGKKDPIGNISRDGSKYALSKCYYLAEKDGDEKDGRIPASASELSSGEIAKSLNDGATGDGAPWKQTVGTDAYPVLDPSHESVNPLKNPDVFVISSVEDLESLRTAVNSGTRNSYVVYITEDIDCNGTTWEPIGTKDHKFKGICYGGGHTISNLNTAENKDMDGVGFFGVVDINTEVRDLFIGSGTISGKTGVGAIIGCANHGVQTEGYINIIGCGNKATIKGESNCGGLIGAIFTDKQMNLYIDNCYNMGKIEATKESAALCGATKDTAQITGSWNSGQVTGYDTNEFFVRGAAGAAHVIIFRNCHNLASLTQQKDVNSFTAAEAKNGTLCLKLNGGSNDASVGLPWEQDISDENATYPRNTVYGNDGKAIYTSRKVSGKYGTVVLPYMVRSNDFIRFYTLTDVTDGEETQLHFHAVDSLLPGTPAIFQVARDSTYEFVSISYEFDTTLNDITIAGWTMTGNLNIDGQNKVFTDSEELKTLYYISGGQIKRATSSLTISPLRAYIKGPSPKMSSAPRSLSLLLDDGYNVTGIRLVQTDTQSDVTSYGIFNLAGQQIDSPQPGISIINGKKYLTK